MLAQRIQRLNAIIITMLHIDKISKSYLDAGTRQFVLHDVELRLEQGTSVSIQGASGSGKSTLLHLLAALDKPDSGHIWLNEQDITQFTERQADHYRQQHIGIVFQKFNLIDCISVLDNVYLPAKINIQNGDTPNDAYIKKLLTTLGIHQHIHKLPNQLSGGEQQRVAIARALAHKPKLLLADEPTGNLDSANSSIVSRLLIDTCVNNNITLVLVTHSEKVAMLTQQQVILLDGKCTQSVKRI